MSELKNKYGHPNSNVLELTSIDFNDTQLISEKTQGKYGIVKFYAPWCGHCKNMVENLEFIAKGLKNLKKPFFIAAVNCDDVKAGNKEIAQRFGIQGFPTLFSVNSNGVLEEFNPTSRDVEGLLLGICDFTQRYETSGMCCRKVNGIINC